MANRTSRVLLAVVLAVAVAGAAMGAGLLHQDHEQSLTNPVSTARDFVIDGGLDQNGYEACQYLTTAQQRTASLWRRTGECRQALDYARLDLGQSTPTNYEVERMPARIHRSGDRVRVQLGHGHDGIALELVRANAAEQSEFQPPHSDWRIASGGLSLLPRAS